MSTAAISADTCTIVVSTDLYSLTAIRAACYKVAGRYFVRLSDAAAEDSTELQALPGEAEEEGKAEPRKVKITLRTQNHEEISEEDVDRFYNLLLDEQVRCDVNAQFGKIRDMLVEEAFRPVEQGE